MVVSGYLVNDYYPHSNTSIIPIRTYTVDIENGTINDLEALFQLMEQYPMASIKAINVSLQMLGVVANTLLLIYLLWSRRYRSIVYSFIMSLCCCDLGACVSGVMFAGVIKPTVSGPGWLCNVSIYTILLFFGSSVLHLVFFSVLRYYQLVFPFKAQRHVTRGYVSRVCLYLWLISIILAIPMPIFYQQLTFLYQGHIYTVCVNSKLVNKLISIFIYIIWFGFSTLIIAGFQIAKHFHVKKHTAIAHTLGQETRRQTNSRAVMLVILLLCITSWPTIINALLRHLVELSYPPGLDFIVTMIVNSLIFGNSVVNPFIYAFLDENVRKDIISMLKCTLPRRK